MCTHTHTDIHPSSTKCELWGEMPHFLASAWFPWEVGWNFKYFPPPILPCPIPSFSPSTLGVSSWLNKVFWCSEKRGSTWHVQDPTEVGCFHADELDRDMRPWSVPPRFYKAGEKLWTLPNPVQFWLARDQVPLLWKVQSSTTHRLGHSGYNVVVHPGGDFHSDQFVMAHIKSCDGKLAIELGLGLWEGRRCFSLPALPCPPSLWLWDTILLLSCPKCWDSNLPPSFWPISLYSLKMDSIATYNHK